MMLNFDIWTFGNGEFWHNIFNAISSAFNDNGLKLMGILISFCVVVLLTLLTRKKELRITTRLKKTIFFHLMVLTMLLVIAAMVGENFCVQVFTLTYLLFIMDDLDDVITSDNSTVTSMMMEKLTNRGGKSW